ncbi:MAG TPA: LPP20 family lipoprotein [Bacteroidota bacterium]|nr:LPP20 family lipoprotein [Bacteroidota bacterium]
MSINMRIRFSALALVMIAHTALAQRPEWIGGKSRAYPDGQFIVGVGSGSTREAAESQARANIGRVFRVDIKSSIRVTRQEDLQSKSGSTTGELTERAVAKVDIGLTKTLEGTEIADVWQEPSGKTYYALAVLEREKAATILSERIREIDDDITTLNDELGKTEDRLAKMRLMVRKKNLLNTQRELNSDHRVVTGKTLKTAFTFEKEMAAIDRFLKQDFMIGIEGKGENVAKLVDDISKHLANRGITVRRVTERNRAKLDVVIVLEFSMDPAKEAVDDWYYCPWQVSIQAVDQESGNVLAAEVKKGRSGQLSIEGAKKRAQFEASKQLESAAAAVAQGLFGT